MKNTEDSLNQNAIRSTHRGKNFTSSDDRNICIAWLTISNDPSKSRDQLGDSFWKDIQEHAKVKKRNCNGVRQRWGLISRCVMKFIECYATVNNRVTDGTLDRSAYDEAIQLHMTTTKTKKWQFAECFEILRNTPKFNHYHQTRSVSASQNLPILVSEPCSLAETENYDTENYDTENYDTESNAEGNNFFGEFNSTSDPSIAYGEDGLENGFRQPDDNCDRHIPFESQQDLDRRRVEALEVLATAAKRKNELLAEYIGALNAATDAKYVTQNTQNLDALSLQILELKKVKILMELQRGQTEQIDLELEQCLRYRAQLSNNPSERCVEM